MAAPGRLILLITQTHIQADGRALRIARSLLDAGYQVAGVGYAHHERSPPVGPDVPFAVATCQAPRSSLTRKLLHAAAMLPTAVCPSSAQSVYWAFPEHRALLAASRNQLAGIARRPDLIIAKDWATAPIAIHLAKETGARLHYDVTEISHAQFGEDWRWRLLVRPFVMEIEKNAFSRAHSCSVYGADGAQHLRNFYSLSARPVIVRNLPRRTLLPERPLGPKIHLLYHGLAAPVRKLEAIIDSVPAWRPDRALILRLTGKPAYIDSLKARASALNVGKRIIFVEPVPSNDVVEAASAADIGLSLLPTVSEQFLFAEPNKLYQYIAAGLAVLAQNLPAMRRVIEYYKVGRLIEARTPNDIAQAINAVDREHIAHFRAAAREAANELCWENEERYLVEAIGQSLSDAA